MIRKSWLLIASILIGQSVCVTAGVLWYVAWQRTIWRESLEEHFLAHNELVTTRTAAKLNRELNLPPDQPPSPAQLAKMQEFTESVSLPKRWSICVIDETGARVAGPGLQRQSAALTTRPGRWLLRNSEGEAPLAEALARSPERAVSGLVRIADEDHLVAARQLDHSRLAVLMLRQSRGLEDLAAAIVVPVRRVGLVTGFALVLLTGVVTRRVINRYENRVARLNEELEEKVRRRSAELLQTRDAVIFGLAKLADSRDQDTGEHLDRIQQLTCLLAEQLRGTHPEIDRAWIERLRLATPLHDIGKVGIPDSILLKPGPLTPAERRTMQRHAEIGAECLAAIGGRLGPNDFLAMARDIAQAHHERYDGAGYPRGLRGNAIPLAARIVALADVYDAATNKRVYKAPQSHAAVRGMILASRGKHFDPTIVDAFLAVEHCFKSNGQRGRVATAGSSGPLFTPRPASKRLVPTV